MTDFSYQLYSSRNFPPLEDTLKMVADLGYKSVEGFGGLFAELDDLGALRGHLGALSLSMKTSHIGIAMVRDETARALEIARIFRMESIYMPHITPEEGRPIDAAGWVALGKTLNELAKPILDAGFGCGWHNHAFEFEALEGGETPIDLLLDNAPDLTLEFDVAWAARAGFDPLITIEKYGSRITAAHVKDIAPQGDCLDEDGWADVGQGVLPWREIFSALQKAATATFVMEHDNPSDHERFARRSITAARSF